MVTIHWYCRGGFCPKDRRQAELLVKLHRELEVSYCRLVTISTDSIARTNTKGATMKTLGQKMFLKKGKTLRIISPPDNLAELLGTHEATLLPERSTQSADVVWLFVQNRAELEARLEKVKNRISPNGALWLAYPKGTSKLSSDINRDTIRKYAATIGLETVSLVSIDDTWSCLRLKMVA